MAVIPLQSAGASSWSRLSVTVPTRDRPAKLSRCLASLAAAQERTEFTAFVCDSSTSEETRAQVAAACAAFPFVELYRHGGGTRAAARNVCVQVARSDLIVTVDDDVYVEPDTIELLLEAYEAGSGPRVVAGTMRMEDRWTGPEVMRRIGYARPALPGEVPSVVVTGLLLYPRLLGLRWEWNERVPAYEDLFMSALWHHHGVQLLHEPRARAVHDGVPHAGVDEQESHIYVNLFDALITRRAPLRASAVELLGFAAGAKLYCRRPRSAARYLCAWGRGHRALIRDWRELRALCEAQPLHRLELESVAAARDQRAARTRARASAKRVAS
jgi:glycosyltransferase involved in cell wall biosynthesis